MLCNPLDPDTQIRGTDSSRRLLNTACVSWAIATEQCVCSVGLPDGEGSERSPGARAPLSSLGSTGAAFSSSSEAAQHPLMSVCLLGSACPGVPPRLHPCVSADYTGGESTGDLLGLRKASGPLKRKGQGWWRRLSLCPTGLTSGRVAADCPYVVRAAETPEFTGVFEASLSKRGSSSSFSPLLTQVGKA